MGGSQAKLVITRPPKETAAENGTHEAVDQNIHQEEGPVASPNGNCSNSEPCEADVTTTCSKKNSPITWIQKKISFKKSRTPKKTSTAHMADSLPSETPAVENTTPVSPDHVATTQTPNTTQEIQISTVDQHAQAHDTSNIHLDSATQVEKSIILDEQAFEHNVPVDTSAFVENAPVLNGVCGNHVDENRSSFEPESNALEVSSNLKSHELSAEVDVAEKLASLQMGTVELMLTNGHDVATDYTEEEN